jgi:hypothetical protein
MPINEPIADPPFEDWPLYWFARLEKAVEQGDHQTAAEAHQELKRLGVHVSYGLSRQLDHSSTSASGVPHVS